MQCFTEPPGALPFLDTSVDIFLRELLSRSTLGLKQSKQGFYMIMDEAKLSFQILTNVLTQQ